MPLAVEQNNYLTKIVNFYIVSDIDAWPTIPLRKFTLNKCLFRATNIIRNSDKEKYVHTGSRKAFDGKGEWRFRNDYARNVISFGTDNSSSSYSENHKNNFINIR